MEKSEIIKDKENERKRSRSRSLDKVGRKNRDRDSVGSQGKNRKRKIEVFVPDTNGPLISFEEFCKLQKVEISTELAKKIHTKYVKRHRQRQIEIFFYEHKV